MKKVKMVAVEKNIIKSTKQKNYTKIKTIKSRSLEKD